MRMLEMRADRLRGVSVDMGAGRLREIVPSWETTSVGVPAFSVFELTAVKSQKGRMPV